MCEICSELTIKTPDDVTDLAIVFLWGNLNIFYILFWCFLVFIVYFEDVIIASWDAKITIKGRF